MSETVDLLDRLAEDADFRREFAEDPQRVVSSFPMTEEEKSAFEKLDLDELERFAEDRPRPIECRILRITW